MSSVYKVPKGAYPNKLAPAVAALGKTQNQLGLKVKEKRGNKTVSGMSGLWHGRHRPSAEMAEQIAQILTEWLAEKTSEPFTIKASDIFPEISFNPRSGRRRVAPAADIPLLRRILMGLADEEEDKAV